MLVLGMGFLSLVALGVTLFFLFRVPWFQTRLMGGILNAQATFPLTEPPAVPPGPPYQGYVPKTSSVLSAADIYQPTNIWTVHLRFLPKHWAALGPSRVPAVANWQRPDGSVVLSNPNASRPGIAGVLGFDMPWSEADVEFGGVRLWDVGARFKGNGTFLGALRTYKRPFKLDLNKYDRAQQLAGRTLFNLHNLSADVSCLSDTLAYEFFREAGVPAPRTAFARVFLTIDGQFDQRLLGLYLLVENLDGKWAREVLRAEPIALFKPVTNELFHDLGDDWAAYEAEYYPKTRIGALQQRRLIELARLVTQAQDPEFAARIGEFIDLDEFACFLACEATLAHYDGILAQGQNFLIYLDPRSNRFGFIPWDQDHSWGEFGLMDTAERRERASLWHPWVGQNRFLERMLVVDDFKRRYRGQIERLLATFFVPDRLARRIDELAGVVRPAIAEESSDKLARFEAAVASQRPDGPRQPQRVGANRPVHKLKRFVEIRARNVRQQLDGQTEGVVIGRRPLR